MLSTSTTTKNFNESINNGTAKVLTLNEANNLIGKKIAWSYNHDCNDQQVYEMVIGKIISSWDYYKTQPMDGFDSRTDYWATYMTAEEVQHEKNRLLIIDDKGNNTSVFCQLDDTLFDEHTFCCSDGDRQVYFIIL